MKDKIEVSKIDIKIGDKTISLKPEQARELKKILNEMFEEQVTHIHHHDHYRYWWNYPYYPTLSSISPQWSYTCQSLANSGSDTSLMNAVTLALND